MPQKPKHLDDTTSVRAWWGVELRNWRNQRGLSAVALGTKVHLSGTSVERIEKNERPCTAELAARFDAALDAGGALVRLWTRVEADADRLRTDADRPADAGRPPTEQGVPAGALGFTSEPTTAVARRSLFAVGGLAALSPAAFAELMPKIGRTPLPRVVRAEDVEQIWIAAASLARWDNLYGGSGIFREAAVGQLHWARGLLSARCPETLRPSLHSAVGRLAVVMGSAAFDAYEHAEAAHLLDFGIWCAETADDWSLRARALNWRSRQAIWCGAPDLGLTFAESGLVRADRLTAREQSMLHNAVARANGKMERRQETLAAIGRSDELFANAEYDEDAPWMAYYDYAQHHGDTGHALFDIALLPGQSPRQANARLQEAVDHHDDNYVRSRAISGTKLATLLMGNGDPQEAAAIGLRAVHEIGKIRSKRALDDLRMLAHTAMPHRLKPEVAELRRHVADSVRA